MHLTHFYVGREMPNFFDKIFENDIIAENVSYSFLCCPRNAGEIFFYEKRF